jgi:hypothetical protein
MAGYFNNPTAGKWKPLVFGASSFPVSRFGLSSILRRRYKLNGEYGESQPPMSDPDTGQEKTLAAFKILSQQLRGPLANVELAGVLDAAIEKCETSGNGAERDGAVSGALEALAGHPKAKMLFDYMVREPGSKSIAETFREFENVPGHMAPVAGTLMVCPKDPTHYSKYLRMAGQQMTCPVHNVSLVPADEAGK